ncbi:MAG TPA: hypothetical protein VGM19_14850 [Armatimonadota bacterium]|jgi:hypothetical protein
MTLARRLWLPLVLAFLVLVPVLAGAALTVPAAVPGLTVATRESLPVAPLRGYGSLGGEYVQYKAASGEPSSILLIQCPDAARAGVTLGKYRSDLRCLGGVTESQVKVGAAQVAVAVVEGQGLIWAARQGATVAVVAAAREADLVTLLGALGVGGLTGLDYTGAPVPVYLDKFDRYGWSFWYGMFATPPDQAATYDFKKEDFEWAQRMGVGVQVAVTLNMQDTAEGVPDLSGTEWAMNLARDMNVPVFVQPFAFAGPLWLANRYPLQMEQKMPQFVGNYYTPEGLGGGDDSPSHLAWTSTEALDATLNALAPAIRKLATYPNLTGYTELHGEPEHNTPAIFMEYGPEADKAYQGYLKRIYGTPQAVDQRWYGGAGTIKSWADVRIPEVASFLGWGPQAVDLRGAWRTAWDNKLPAESVAQWASPDLDDAAWETKVAPGDDHNLWRSQRRVPAIYRRSFDLPAARLAELTAAGQGKCYLYVWDMEQASGQKVQVALNGAVVGERTIPSWRPNWCVFEVSAALRAGQNLLALHLPWGYLSYRVYLSPNEPRCYPDLGAQVNARWVDFRDFTTWNRYDAMKRTMEMYRREDPNRYIKQMAVGGNLGISKALSEDYGGAFHDTGGMGGNLNDFLPTVSRGAGMPFTAEPGNPAHNLMELKNMVGLYASEGVNAVDYFMHMGDISWDPERRAWFEANQPFVHLFGKYHGPTAAVAVLHGARGQALIDYPWDQMDTPLLWNGRHGPLGLEGYLPYPRDVLVEGDFARGNADRYQIILDDNTMVMDEALVTRIEAWVRAGGTFIACGHSGQHTPEVANAAPISRLTGYKMIGNDDNRRIIGVPGQKLLTDPYWFQTDPDGRPALGGAGMMMQKVAPDAIDLIAWENNGGIAAGARQLGKGWIITTGTYYSREGWAKLLYALNQPVLNASAENCQVSTYASNNGLYDVYMVWGQRMKDGGTTTLNIPGMAPQTPLRDLLADAKLTGAPVAGGVSFPGLAFNQLDTRPYLAPRGKLAEAPLEWLRLQRSWWKGTVKPGPAPTTKATTSNGLDLSRDWLFAPVPEGVAGADLAGLSLNDKTWDTADLGCWNVVKYGDISKGLFRKHFTTPAGWVPVRGRTYLYLHGTDAATLRPPYKTKVYLDGQQLWASGNSQYDSMCVEITQALTLGPHVVAVEAESSTKVGGVVGGMWLEFVPEPALRQSLAGDWGNGMQLPGQVKDLTGARRTFVPNPQGQGKTVMVYVEATTMHCIYINGKYLPRMNVPYGTHFRFNITPWIKWGEENVIEMQPHYTNPNTIGAVELRYYDPQTLQ